MRLELKDVHRLYGNTFFRIGSGPETPARMEAEDVSQVIAEPLPFFSGNPVAWKMKPGATLALVLRAEEFSARALTGQLRKWVDEAGIATHAVGFGILEGNGPGWDFSEMPVPYAIVFGCDSLPEGSQHEIGAGQIILMESLESLIGKGKTDFAVQMLRSIQQKIREA
jgi:hypothetical protein